jgi:hypothetical protein
LLKTPIRIIKNKRIGPYNILISFDIVSLFTKIPLNEVVHVVKDATDPKIDKLGEVCLRSTFLLAFKENFMSKPMV